MGCRSLHQSQKEPATLENCGGYLGEKTDNGQRMRRLKLLKVTAFKNRHRMTVRRGKSEDCPKVPCDEIGRAIRVKAGRLVDIARKGEELNPWTDERDNAGRSSITQSQGRRIHGSHYGFVFINAIQTMRVKKMTQ